VAKERDIQVASLGSLASEVSALYGLRSDPAMVAASTEQIQEAQVHSSLDQLYALKHTALSGAASVGISLGLTKNSTTADWIRANSAPNLWPVEGLRSPAPSASASIRSTEKEPSTPVSIFPLLSDRRW
jgi:hypothetical protein